MERKGHLTSDGRVVWDPKRPDVVADLSLDVQRYNLRRVLVSRTWRADVAAMDDLPARRFTGDTRREVIDQALAYIRGGSSATAPASSSPPRPSPPSSPRPPGSATPAAPVDG